MLTATHTSKTARIIKGDIPIITSPNVNVLLNNIKLITERRVKAQYYTQKNDFKRNLTTKDEINCKPKRKKTNGRGVSRPS